MPNDFMIGLTPRRRVSPRLPCPKCRQLCPIEARICTCGHWLIGPSVVNDEVPVSRSPKFDVVENREAPPGLSSAVSRDEEVPSFRERTIPIERVMDLAAPVPSIPRQMDEFLSLLTGSEPGELSESVSVSTPTSESETQISDHVSVEPGETMEVLSNTSTEAPDELDVVLSSLTPTTPEELEEPLTQVDWAAPTEIDEVSTALNLTETRAVADVYDTFSETAPTQLAATFSVPEQLEIDETRATSVSGYKVALKRTAIGIGRIEKYLAIAAVFVFVASLFIYGMRPLEDVSRDSDFTAQDADGSRSGSDPQTTVVPDDPAPKKVGVVEWQSFRPGSPDRSPNRVATGSTSENFSPAIATPSQSQLGEVTTSPEPYQPSGEKALPTRRREKVERKKVTADDLIKDKKKVTVDDLINDN